MYDVLLSIYKINLIKKYMIKDIFNCYLPYHLVPQKTAKYQKAEIKTKIKCIRTQGITMT